MRALRNFVWLAGTAAILITGHSVARAESLNYSALLSRIESLEAELADQRTDFVSYSMGGGAAQNDGCGTCGGGKGSCSCECPAWYASYELTVLRPYVSDWIAGPGFDNEYGAGHRFVIGRQGGNGVGFRVRSWFYNHGHQTVPPAAPASLNIDMDAVDLELTLQERLCNWDLLVSGGVRYGRAEFGLGAVSTFFEGTGPTVALEASREIGCRGLYLVGNFRASMLIGEIDPGAGGGLPGFPARVLDDEITTVLESQLGVGWAREMGRGELHLRGLWETQFWLNDTFADDTTFGSNLGLSGFTLAAEIRI